MPMTRAYLTWLFLFPDSHDVYNSEGCFAKGDFPFKEVILHFFNQPFLELENEEGFV